MSVHRAHSLLALLPLACTNHVDLGDFTGSSSTASSMAAAATAALAETLPEPTSPVLEAPPTGTPAPTPFSGAR